MDLILDEIDLTGRRRTRTATTIRIPFLLRAGHRRLLDFPGSGMDYHLHPRQLIMAAVITTAMDMMANMVETAMVTEGTTEGTTEEIKGTKGTAEEDMRHHKIIMAGNTISHLDMMGVTIDRMITVAVIGVMGSLVAVADTTDKGGKWPSNGTGSSLKAIEMLEHVPYIQATSLNT